MSADPINAALDALAACALAPHDPVRDRPCFDGRLRRYRVADDKAGSENGWMIFHGDGLPAGAFGSWKTGQSETWCSKADHEISAAERAERARHLASAKAHRDQEEQHVRAQARQRAADLWEKCRDTVDARHPYLLAKEIPAIGLRQLKDSLVVPVRDIHGGLHSLQFINPDGRKTFLTGGAIEGNFALLGAVSAAETLLIAEGYATAVSIRRACEMPVAVAFTAGNLGPVGAALRRQFPAARLIFAGDDDRWTPGNPGRTAATKAAAAVQGFAVFPDFGPLSDDERPSDWNDLQVRVGVPAFTARLLAALDARALQGGPPAAPPPGEAAADGADDWEAALFRTRSGDVITSPANIETVLQQHAAWAGVLAYDDMAYRTVKRRAPPYPHGEAGEWSDADDTWSAIWLERHYGIRPRNTAVAQVVGATGKAHRFHQITDWLDSLPPWDGTDRLPTFFSDHCGAQQTAYTAAVARSFFISAVARVYQPGCKVDTMLVLEGKQGIGKSRLILALFSPKWHIEISYQPGSLDFYQSLRGAWCAEFGELAAFDKGDWTRLKQVLTQVQDTYRASYGHHAGTFPRQSIFVGSTNKREWGLDETGMRRFLPVWCEEVHVEAVAAIREQLWAEARARFQSGEPWWNIPDAEHEQEARYDYDAWEELVAVWLEQKEKYEPHLKFSVNDAYQGAIHGAGARTIPPITRADQIRLGRVLTRLGWQRKRSPGGKREYLYEKAPS